MPGCLSTYVLVAATTLAARFQPCTAIQVLHANDGPVGGATSRDPPAGGAPSGGCNDPGVMCVSGHIEGNLSGGGGAPTASDGPGRPAAGDGGIRTAAATPGKKLLSSPSGYDAMQIGGAGHGGSAASGGAGAAREAESKDGAKAASVGSAEAAITESDVTEIGVDAAEGLGAGGAARNATSSDMAAIESEITEIGGNTEEDSSTGAALRNATSAGGTTAKGAQGNFTGGYAEGTGVAAAGTHLLDAVCPLHSMTYCCAASGFGAQFGAMMSVFAYVRRRGIAYCVTPWDSMTDNTVAGRLFRFIGGDFYGPPAFGRTFPIHAAPAGWNKWQDAGTREAIRSAYFRRPKPPLAHFRPGTPSFAWYVYRGAGVGRGHADLANASQIIVDGLRTLRRDRDVGSVTFFSPGDVGGLEQVADYCNTSSLDCVFNAAADPLSTFHHLVMADHLITSQGSLFSLAAAAISTGEVFEDWRLASGRCEPTDNWLDNLEVAGEQRLLAADREWKVED